MTLSYSGICNLILWSTISQIGQAWSEVFNLYSRTKFLIHESISESESLAGGLDWLK